MRIVSTSTAIAQAKIASWMGQSTLLTTPTNPDLNTVFQHRSARTPPLANVQGLGDGWYRTRLVYVNRAAIARISIGINNGAAGIVVFNTVGTSTSAARAL
jgi:hypothetical protein